MNMPGLTAEISLHPTLSVYCSTTAGLHSGDRGSSSGIMASFITHGCNFQCGYLCLWSSGSWCCCLPVFPKAWASAQEIAS
jgi:hypothetical protein